MAEESIPDPMQMDVPEQQLTAPVASIAPEPLIPPLQMAAAQMGAAIPGSTVRQVAPL